MAYDEGLATRLRDALVTEPGVVEKKMFGGLAMMVNGNMAVGVYGDDLLVRTDPAEQQAILAEPGTRPFEMGARAAKGFVVVAADSCADDDDLQRWVARGLGYAHGLQPK